MTNNKKTQHSKMLKSDVWTVDDINHIATEVHNIQDYQVNNFFKASNDSSNFPKPLDRKSRSSLNQDINHLQSTFDTTHFKHVPKCDVYTFLSSLSSQIDFMKSQNEKRGVLKDSLKKIYTERSNITKAREKLSTESKTLTGQIDEQKKLRSEMSHIKTKNENTQIRERQQYHREMTTYQQLRESLEKAKFSELEVRRRLDRMRLKVAALRGEMITSSVDKLAKPRPKWHGDLINLIDGSPKKKYDCDKTTPDGSLPDGSAVSNENDEEQNDDIDVEMKPDTQQEQEQQADDEHITKDYQMDYDINESADEMEFRLLQNRLAMCEMEAREWRDCLETEQTKVNLITKARTRLEEELARIKQGSGMKSSSGGNSRIGGKSLANSARATARVRATIRASLANLPNHHIKKPSRKSRKGQPKQSLLI